jgi:hypothetical protein
VWIDASQVGKGKKELDTGGKKGKYAQREGLIILGRRHPAEPNEKTHLEEDGGGRRVYFILHTSAFGKIIEM